MKIGALIIGDEILSGRRADKHLARTIELLGARGMQLSWARYVGDDPERITQELREAFASGDLVFSFGGIGATPDDHTRACAAQACGRELALHPQARELILQRSREVAAEKGDPFDPDHPDTLRRLDMGRFPADAEIIPNPYNRIPGFLVGSVYFVPGFPVMAWPMVEWVLDTRYSHLHRRQPWAERALIVLGSMEATLTPLMVEIEQRFAGVKVFSLPSVDHPQWGRHIELGVKGEPELVDQVFAWLTDALHRDGVKTGPEVGRQAC
jgi:molybdopterin-biosynthesis enzyme MoeA-like protein